MTPATALMVEALDRLLDLTIRGRPDLSEAASVIGELAEAFDASRGDVLDDHRLLELWTAVSAIVNGDRLSGLGWVELLPLLHRATRPLAAVVDAFDLDL